MSETYTEMLKANYERMHTDILIETKLKGGLTEEATKILEEELHKRNINDDEINEYKDSDTANYRPVDFAEGIKLGDLASTGKRYIAQIVDQVIGITLIFIVMFGIFRYPLGKRSILRLPA